MSAKIIYTLSDENPGSHKKFGCMNRIFQVFEGQRFLHNRRDGGYSHHKKLPTGRRQTSKIESKSNRAFNKAMEKTVSSESSSCPDSSSSWLSSSFSSADNYYCRTSQMEPRLSDNRMSQGTHIHQPYGLRDVVKDSIHREPRRVMVRSMNDEEEEKGRIKLSYVDSPRPSSDETEIIRLKAMMKLQEPPRELSSLNGKGRTSSSSSSSVVAKLMGLEMLPDSISETGLISRHSRTDSNGKQNGFNVAMLAEIGSKEVGDDERASSRGVIKAIEMAKKMLEAGDKVTRVYRYLQKKSSSISRESQIRNQNQKQTEDKNTSAIRTQESSNSGKKQRNCSSHQNQMGLEEQHHLKAVHSSGLNIRKHGNYKKGEASVKHKPKKKISTPGIRAERARLDSVEAAVQDQQPSPVSVLDAVFCGDESPSPVKMISRSFKEEEQSHSEEAGGANEVQNDPNLLLANSALEEEVIRENSILQEREHIEHKYIFEILSTSGILKDPESSLITVQLQPRSLPLSPNVFLALEQGNSSVEIQKGRDNESVQIRKAKKVKRKLIFDTVNEILAQRIVFWGGFSKECTKLRMVSGKRAKGFIILQTLCSEIDRLQAQNPNCNLDDHDCCSLRKGIYLEDLVNHEQEWTDLQSAIPGIALDVERLIFKDLISEVVGGEIGAAIARARPSRHQSKFSHRELNLQTDHYKERRGFLEV